tara:strand:+ start:1834 stop:3036 length:1203 start_codon:yes stop_codon:yes gene_type:complete
MKISSLNLTGINKAVSGITETIRDTKLVIDDISEKITKSNENIRNRISDATKLFQRRRQAVRRKQREDLIEASGIGGAIRRTNKVISSSTRGFFGRILDFVATILIGWAVVNIPKIVKLAENLFKRLKKFLKVVTGFSDGLVQFYTQFTTQLSEIGSRLTSIDLEPISDQIRNIVTRLQSSFKRLETGFLREVLGLAKMKDQDLINFGFSADDIEKEDRKIIDQNIEDQNIRNEFDELPVEIQDALKLKMSIRDDKKLNEVELEVIKSKDIEEIKRILLEDNIIPIVNDLGEIEYRIREQENDLLKDIKDGFGNLFNKITGTNDADAMSIEEMKMIINKMEKEKLLKEEERNKDIIIKRKTNTNNVSFGEKKRFEPNLSMVNSNNQSNLIKDLAITKEQQ